MQGSWDEDRSGTVMGEAGRPAKDSLSGHLGQQPGHAALILACQGSEPPRPSMADVVNIYCPHLLTLRTLQAGTLFPLSLHPDDEHIRSYLARVLSMTSQRKGN